MCSGRSVPGKLGGAWVLRGTRLPVATVFENLEDLSIEEVMEQFDVTREEIQSLLEFAARRSQTPLVLPTSPTTDARPF